MEREGDERSEAILQRLEDIIFAAGRECDLENSELGGSGDSPSTGEPSGTSSAVATACLTAARAVFGVGNGGGGSEWAMVSR
eukprot:scaffold201474_cov86-Cyclotella_meneghiniana.AAC.4